MHVAAVFLPFLAFLIVGSLGAKIGDKVSQYITAGGTGLAAVCSLFAFYEVVILGEARTVEQAI